MKFRVPREQAPSPSEVVDLHRLQRVRRSEPEDPREKVKLPLDRPADILGLPEAVRLPLKLHVRHRQSILPQRVDQPLCLVRRDDLVIQTLEKNDGAGESLDVMDGRPLDVDVPAFRVGPDQTVQVA